MQSRLSSLVFFIVTLISLTANSQNLFGNPSCENWKTLPTTEKTTWLSAYLIPLNLTNVSRKKPREDKFSQLTSLTTAVDFVDSFCHINADELAAVGAIKFLDELTTESPSK